MERNLILLRLFLVLIAGFHGFAVAQTKFMNGPEELRKVPESIIASAASGNIVGAMKQLRPYNVVEAAQYDLFEAQVNSQIGSIVKQFGKPSGYEFIREEKLGSRLVRQVYFVFHEKAPIQWTFVMYKAEKGWVVTHYAFEGNASTFFK